MAPLGLVDRISIQFSGVAESSRYPGWLIGLLGLLSILAHAPTVSPSLGLATLVITIGLPSVLGLVIVGIGYRTARNELVDPEEAWRLAGWIIVGMVVFLLVGVWIVTLDALLGRSVPFGYLLTVNAVTLGGVAGAVIGLYDAQSREHTRRIERRERELEEQNRRLDEFVSIVSHDLRNPLSVADARLDLAREEYDGEHLEHVARSHERMEALIDDLLQLARQNKSVTETEVIDLADMAGNAWRNVDSGAATFHAEADAVIRADPSRFQQLLENLLRNAVEHGGEDVRITIDTIDAEGFSVEDDGRGIPADEREQVFESGYSTNTDGTGFGLSIVKGVADAHGWEVSVTDGERGGARFEFTGVDID